MLFQLNHKKISVLQVPRHPPATRELWSEWTKMWPIVWRQPDEGPLALRAEAPVANPAAIGEMQGWMRQAWQLALDAKAAGHAFNAAIIVDPSRGRHRADNGACHAPWAAISFK